MNQFYFGTVHREKRGFSFEIIAPLLSLVLTSCGGGGGGGTSASLRVTGGNPVSEPITDDHRPVFSSDSYIFRVEENSSGFVGKVLATDADNSNNRVTYSLEGETHGFTIDSSSGAISGTSFDYEMEDRFSLRVVATSNERSDRATVVVNVTDVNEAPSLIVAPSLGHIPSFRQGDSYTFFGLFTGSIEAFDADVGDGPANLTVTVVNSPNTGALEIRERISAISRSNDWTELRDGDSFGWLDISWVRYTAGNASSAQITLLLTDTGGATAGPITMRLAPNSVPQVGARIADWTFGKAESAVFRVPDKAFDDTEDDDALTYSLVGVMEGGSDATPSWLRVQPNGLVNISNQTKNAGTYSVTISVSDGVTGVMAAETSFDIVIGDSGESLVSLDNASIPQGGTEHFSVASKFTGENLTFESWRQGGFGLPEWLALDSQTGVFSLRAPDDSAVGNYSIVVQATGSQNAVGTFTLEVENVNDGPEVFLKLANGLIPQGNGSTYAFRENAFTDPDFDNGDNLSFTAEVDGTPTDMLSWVNFDSSSRTFTLNEQAPEGPKRVLVIATDKAGATASGEFTLTVQPDVETPPTADRTVSIHEMYPLNKVIVKFDEHVGLNPILQAGVADNDLFTIDNDANLRWRSVPDYEAPKDSNWDNDYRVLVTSGGLSGTSSTANIHVMDIVQEVDGSNNRTIFATGIGTYSLTPGHVPDPMEPSNQARYILDPESWFMPDEGPLILTWSLGTDHQPDATGRRLVRNLVNTQAEIDNVRSELLRAFEIFESHINVKFIEVAETEGGIRGDISVNFLDQGNYGEGGHAFSPPLKLPARVDNAKQLIKIYPGVADLERPLENNHLVTILHEIGHTLGIHHPGNFMIRAWSVPGEPQNIEQSEIPNSVMGSNRPQDSSGNNSFELGTHDIEALQFKYGKPGGNWKDSAEQYLPYSLAVRDLERTGHSSHTEHSVVWVDENLPTGTPAFQLGPTGGSLFNIVAGEFDSDLFTIDHVNGAVYFKMSPDYENPHDGGWDGTKYDHDNGYYVLVSENASRGAIRHKYLVIVEDISTSVGTSANDNVAGLKVGAVGHVFGDEGNDTITLGEGTEAVVYRLGVDETDAAGLDGYDTVAGFSLGTDAIILVDTNSTGDTASLTQFLERINGVHLDYDGTDFIGIVFDIDGTHKLDITFTTTLDETALRSKLGGVASSISEMDLASALTNGIPTSSGEVAMSVAGFGYIDDLFLLDDPVGGMGIMVMDTLPVELQ